MNKPPAFQFYAKDWLTSETVLSMSERDEGLFIRLLAYSWNSSDPGTLPLPLRLTARLTGKPLLRLRSFLDTNPMAFREVDGRLINDKLYSIWLGYKELSEKRRLASLSKNNAIAKQLVHSALASALASASKDLKQTPSAKPAQACVDFNSFWEAYPRKIKKPSALKAWGRAKANLNEVLAGIIDWVSSGSWNDKQFIPYPATFLNQRMWEDRPDRRNSRDVSPESYVGTGPTGGRMKPEAVAKYEARQLAQSKPN